MIFLWLTLWMQSPLPSIKFIEPVETDFAGKTMFRLESDVPEDDLIGVELFIHGGSVHYFDAVPFEVQLDMSRYPAGPITIKAVLERFGGNPVTTEMSGVNHHYFEEENVHLVRVPVTVQNGKSLGLKAADFVIEEDGQRREIAHLFDESKPMQLVVLLDVSGSMERHLPMLRRSTSALLDTLKAGDRVQIIGFNHEVFEVCPPEEDIELVKKQLYTLRAEGSTNLYGALWSGVRATSKTNQRRALVVFTDGDHDMDGVPDPYNKSLQDSIDLAREHGIPVFALGLGVGVKPGVLNQLSEDTGGRSFLFRSMKAARKSFVEIGTELRRQYLVCYYTDAQKGGWRLIEVKTKEQQMLRHPKKVFLR